jgi:hypothetical protein
MSIARSSYQSTVDLAYPDEDVNLLGQKIDKKSTKPWSVEHRKPLAILAFFFVVLFGYNAGAIYGATASMLNLPGQKRITITVKYQGGSRVEGAYVHCYDADDNDDEDMGSGYTDANGIATFYYDNISWDTYWLGPKPDIYCKVGGQTSRIYNDEDKQNLDIGFILDEPPSIIIATVVRADNTPSRDKHVDCYDTDYGGTDQLIKAGVTDVTGVAKLEYYKGIFDDQTKRNIYCLVGYDRSAVIENFNGDVAYLKIKLSY